MSRWSRLRTLLVGTCVVVPATVQFWTPSSPLAWMLLLSYWNKCRILRLVNSSHLSVIECLLLELREFWQLVLCTRNRYVSNWMRGHFCTSITWQLNVKAYWTWTGGNVFLQKVGSWLPCDAASHPWRIKPPWLLYEAVGMVGWVIETAKINQIWKIELNVYYVKPL